jgi:hypothetical protein
MRRGRTIFVLVLIVGAVGIYAGWPRKADLRAFDPAAMARLETGIWRDYYEKRYPALFYHLDQVSRTQFGFSPIDSFRIALAAAEAAKTFQPTQSWQAANAALPALVNLLSAARSGWASSLQSRGGGAARARLVAGTARGRWRARL